MSKFRWAGALTSGALAWCGLWTLGRGQQAGSETAKVAAIKPAEIKDETLTPEEQAEEKILTALKSPTVMEFKTVSLADIVDFVKDRHGIAAGLDAKALDDAGVGQDTPVTVDYRGISLKSALKRILAPLDLIAIVDDEALLITTMDEAGQRLRVKMYDVSDLLEQDRLDRERFGELGAVWDYDPLIELITSTVAHTTWDNVGGPGAIGGHFGILIVDQTDEVNGEIKTLLTKLRVMLKARPPLPEIPRAVGARGAMSVKQYSVGLTYRNLAPPKAKAEEKKPLADEQQDLPKEAKPPSGNGLGPPNPEESFRVAADLARAIPTLIAPGTWQVTGAGGEGSIQPLAPLARFGGEYATLLVRQTPEVHAQIKRLLADLRHGKVVGPLSWIEGGGFFCVPAE